MSFLHPELFDGAIVVSGFPYYPMENTRENDMRNYIGSAKELSFLVIHGTDDHALDIKETDDFVSKLKEAGYNVIYERVPGGGHGDISVKPMIDRWLVEQFSTIRRG